MYRSYFPLACLLLAMSASAQSADSGAAARYEDPTSQGQVRGVGLESQDIVAVSDEMVRDIVGDAEIMRKEKAPRIIMDAEYFKNESTQRINKNLIVDRLRVALQRASRGRLVFVSRESAAMVAAERDLKRDGVVDVGTTGLTKAQAGGDYRLVGRISSLDSRSSSTGTVERYTQLSFELIDLESGVSQWANQYELKKSGRDDAIYR